MKILIAGGGIAGLTLAYWLLEQGKEVTIIEKAAEIERHGFLIGFRGVSVSILERMGLLERALGLAMNSIHHDILSSRGQKINQSLYLSYKENPNGKLPMNRADLYALLYEAVKDRATIHFGMRIQAVEQHPTHVDVQLSSGQWESAAYLIGADGVHSTVRRLVFGEGYEQVLNASYAAFISPKIAPVRSAVQFARGRMSVLYDLNPGQFGGIFVLKDYDFAQLAPAQRKTALIEAHPLPLADALAQLSDDTPIFVDKLTQIVMPRWVSGRVALVGDAAYCLSPASGFGATAAIAGAYVLAGAIAAQKLDLYENQMRPGIEKKSRASAAVIKQIVSENPLMIGVRDFLLRVISEKATHKSKAFESFGISL